MAHTKSWRFESPETYVTLIGICCSLSSCTDIFSYFTINDAGCLLVGNNSSSSCKLTNDQLSISVPIVQEWCGWGLRLILGTG